MHLERLENEQLDAPKLKELKQICWWANKNLDTDIYVLKEGENIKSVFVMKRFGQVISTTKELDFGTKKEEQGKGYASVGLELLIAEITKRKDIKEVYIQALNPITSKIISKSNVSSDGMGTYIINNLGFDIKYDQLCEMIKNGSFNYNDLVQFCGEDYEMLSIAKKWIKANDSQKNPKIDDVSSSGVSM